MGKRDSKPMVAEDDPGFSRFWHCYPKRVSKKDARIAWAKLNPSAALVDRMVETLAWQCRQPDWVKDGGQYVPFPASWIRAERWTDEPPAVPQVAVPKSLSGVHSWMLKRAVGD